MLVLVGGDRAQEALHRQDAGVVLQGVRQALLHPEAGAERLVQEAGAGVNEVDQVPKAGSGVARQRHADRELHRFGFLRCRRFRGLGRVPGALEACCGKGVDDLLDGGGVGVLVPNHRAVLLDRDAVNAVGHAGHALVGGLDSGLAGDDADQLLAVASGYVVVDFHGMYLRSFFPLGYCIYHSERQI